MLGRTLTEEKSELSTEAAVGGSTGAAAMKLWNVLAIVATGDDTRGGCDCSW